MEAVLKTSASQTQFQPNAASEFWLNLGGRDYRLVGKMIRIGRAADNDIVIDDRSASRYHAVLSITSTAIILEDLKSRNGSKVNGSRIKRMELKSGDEVDIGDLKGLFYERSKSKNISPELQKIAVEVSRVAQGVFYKIPKNFQGFSKQKKIILAASALGLLILSFGLLNLFSGSPSPLAEAEKTEKKIVRAEIDSKAFDRCIELEDLGNYRQSAACFHGLPFTAEVKLALDRIQNQQESFAQQRFQEGEQAFRNYYYDVAIQKWQEVVLIADDESKYFAEAMKGIVEAEQRKR